MKNIKLKSTGEVVLPLEMPKHFNTMYQFIVPDNDSVKNKDYVYLPFGFKMKKIHSNKTVNKDNYMYVLINGAIQLVNKNNLHFA